MTFSSLILQLFLYSSLWSSCNHLFYYPSPHTYATPGDLGISYDRFSLETEDKVSLVGWHLRSKKDPRGVIVQFHGNAENMTSHFLNVAWFTEEGFDVFVFDYRGYGGSQGETTREGSILDGRAMLRYICSHPVYGKLPLFVIGQSLGGAVAVVSVALEAPSSCLRTLVVDSSFASYRRLARAKLSDMWLTWPFQWPLSFLISSRFDPEDYIERVNVPVLFIHDRRDPIVPFEAGQELFRRAKAPKSFWPLDQGGHTYGFAEKNKTMRQAIVKELLKRVGSTRVYAP